MMPTTTNPTPAEISRLECDIAERVMEWKRYTEGAGRFISNYYLPPDRAAVMVGETGATGWSPWNNAADAWKVLERLQEMWSRGKAVPIIGIESYRRGNAHGGEKLHAVSISLCVKVRDVPGPHFGPAVCRLAEKVMEGR